MTCWTAMSHRNRCGGIAPCIQCNEVMELLILYIQLDNKKLRNKTKKKDVANNMKMKHTEKRKSNSPLFGTCATVLCPALALALTIAFSSRLLSGVSSSPSGQGYKFHRMAHDLLASKSVSQHSRWCDFLQNPQGTKNDSFLEQPSWQQRA